ncbi:MAG: transglutaminase-like domain-containing protein [Bacteroidia bacterium]|nr:transglutaminase-like domain-containing protein [Bacteroidia bacterium]
MTDKEIKALISLLDDQDQEVQEHIQDKLLTLGTEVIPLLEDAWGGSFDAILQERIEEVIHKIQFEVLVDEVNDWAANNSSDLLEGAILIAKYQYPDLSIDKIEKELERIKRDAWLEMNDNYTALEKVRVLNKVFFGMHNFNGNTVNFHAPQNSYINTVLETRKGNPLLLCIIYAVIANQLKMPVYGVNLPEHFVLAYKNEMEEIKPKLPTEAKDILFYINPFSKGTVFDKKEIDSFLKKLKIEPKEFFYQPCTNVDIIKRLLRNLIYSYDKLGHTEKSEELTHMLEQLSKTVPGN